MLRGDSHHAGGRKVIIWYMGKFGHGQRGTRKKKKKMVVCLKRLIRGAASQDAEERCAAVLAARLAWSYQLQVLENVL